MAGCSAGPNIASKLDLRSGWAGFNLVRVGTQAPMLYQRGGLLIISGCVTTTSPMSNKAGWDLTIGFVDPRCVPPRDVIFLAPTMMSRYEGIYQSGTSTKLKSDGKLQIYFGKNTNPMVLHLCGICCIVSNEEPIPIEIADYELRDWLQQPSKLRNADMRGLDESARALVVDEQDPPALQRCGNIVCLQGMLQEATYGPISQNVGTLPEGLRPCREIRCLANLLQRLDGGQDAVEHSVAMTLRPSGAITVQGGKVHMIDQKGNMRVLQQKKKGRLSFDGIRFALCPGRPVEASAQLASSGNDRAGAGKAKLGYLMSDGGEQAFTAACIMEGDVVMLEGHLSWTLERPPNPKQPLATLPQGCWPQFRQVFFTRGGSDLEERRRVDVDQYGRIFCPEGAPDGRLELTGVIFVAAEQQGPPPKVPDWDELKVRYQRNEVNVVSTSFDGHELLEQFVRRCNYHEWSYLKFDFARHSGRSMLLPLGQVALRGREGWNPNPMNLGKWQQGIWQQYCTALKTYSITTFHTLLHLSDDMFDQVARAINMREEDRVHLMDQRRRYRLDWMNKRQPGITFSYLQGLATEIVDQMFEHWDFKAQLQGALQNDLRAPQTIEHLFPSRQNGQDRFVRKKLKAEEVDRFEEARQFFYLYETTGSNMTHCSLMGSSDVFTTTGKWFFPDDEEVQKELFKHIAWLFPRKIYLYISERQTSRFPFIEDLDIQCRTDWQGPLQPGEIGTPPDLLLMNPPQREGSTVYGDPGELMKKRAQAVHMIYPYFDVLEVLVFSASGYNKGKDMLKSSFHLVWPQLMVDPDRAPVIRHVTLGLFRNETNEKGSFLNKLQTQLLELHESNNWELVFDSTTINARNGLRLPFSDKASMVIANEEDKKKVKEGTLSKTRAFKTRVREGRPSKAIGRIVFEFETDPATGESNIKTARWDKDAESYPIEKWIEMGSCRREPSKAELTRWQVGPDVLAMLPTKPGEKFTFEGEADGEGGHWVTHKPFSNIRRCTLETKDFRSQFNEALNDEQDQLKEEQNIDLLRRIVGSWVSLTDKQAIWRATAAMQFDGKDPNKVWARGTGTIHRPAEVLYLRGKGKIIVDGQRDVVEVLIRVLKPFTKLDDVAVMPIYDVAKIS